MTLFSPDEISRTETGFTDSVYTHDAGMRQIYTGYTPGKFIAYGKIHIYSQNPYSGKGWKTI